MNILGIRTVLFCFPSCQVCQQIHDKTQKQQRISDAADSYYGSSSRHIMLIVCLCWDPICCVSFPPKMRLGEEELNKISNLTSISLMSHRPCRVVYPLRVCLCGVWGVGGVLSVYVCVCVRAPDIKLNMLADRWLIQHNMGCGQHLIWLDDMMSRPGSWDWVWE